MKTQSLIIRRRRFPKDIMYRARIQTEQNGAGQWSAWVGRRLVNLIGRGPTEAEAVKDLMHQLAAADAPASKVHDWTPKESTE